MSWEQQKRVILPFLQRAEEIEKVERKVAYYCRLYAVDQGIRIEKRTQEADHVLGKVLSHLENDKPHIHLDQETDGEYCKEFALGVFRNAENKDRAGEASRETAKGYYASSIFLEILKQFGELSEELEQIRRYAIFRATEIKKSLDKGEDVTPLPGNEGSVDKSAILGSANSVSSAVDPGYQPGLSVFYSEDGHTVKATGIIKDKLSEDGSQWAVELQDGQTVQASLDLLAPDLPEQCRVLYAPEPGGSVMEAKVVQVEHTTIWPPMYIIETPEGDQQACGCKNLTLIPDKVPGNPPVKLDLIKGPPRRRRSDEVPDGTIQPDADGLVNSNSGAAMNSHALSESASPQNQRPPDPSEAAPTPIVQNHIHGHNSSASSIDQGGALSGSVPEQHLNGGPGVLSSGPPVAPDTPARATAAGQRYVNSQAFKSRESSTVPGAPATDATRPATQVVNPVVDYRPVQGYTPDIQSIESAKKYAKFAASSLGFDDVDSAVKYLNDALRLLTRPGGQ